MSCQFGIGRRILDGPVSVPSFIARAGRGAPTACGGNQVGHQTLSSNEPAGRSRSHRLTALLLAPWGQEQNNFNPTTFQHADKERKCEKLWTLSAAFAIRQLQEIDSQVL